jgi:hypothetical protein
MESPVAAKGKLIDGELPISHVHQVHAWSSAHSIPNKPLAWCDKYVYMQQWRWSKCTKICNETETLVHPKTSLSVSSCWHWCSEASCYEADGAIWGPSSEWHNPWNNCQFLTSIFSLKFSLWAAISTRCKWQSSVHYCSMGILKNKTDTSSALQDSSFLQVV